PHTCAGPARPCRDARQTSANDLWACSARLQSSVSFAVAIEPLAHFLAGLEVRHMLLMNRHLGPGARIAASSRRAFLHRERAEAAQLDAITARHRGDDLAQNGVDDILDIALIKVRVLLGDLLDQF